VDQHIYICCAVDIRVWGRRGAETYARGGIRHCKVPAIGKQEKVLTVPVIL
jgi:hypothetical protein